MTIKGAKHYGIYNEARDQTRTETIAWLDEYLNAATAAPKVNK